MELNADSANILLSFNDSTRRDVFTLTIINDDMIESEEELTLELTLLHHLASKSPSRVIVSPNVSYVRILDDDGKVLLRIIFV